MTHAAQRLVTVAPKVAALSALHTIGGRSIFSFAHPLTARLLVGFFALCAAVSILITAGIVLSIVLEAVRFFQHVPVWQFLTGTNWSPQQAGVNPAEAFGAVPLFVGTLLIMLIAMAVAVPVGLLSAIYLAEYATPTLRNTLKPALEMLAGIPTVVYGVIAIMAVAPLLRGVGQHFGLSVASESALGAGLVMGIMIIPFISSLSDDIISSIPNALREASFGLGATRSETICKVVLPAALPGIMGALLLAMSRAIGETMIVVMAAGMAANLSFNPLDAVTTVTVQMVALLVGDQEFNSPKTLAAFGLGLTLFVVTLLLNICALWIVKRYRQHYE
jgi:phosphate transport system permease protein